MAPSMPLPHSSQRRKITGGLCLVVLVLAAAACGSGSSKADATGSTTTTSGGTATTAAAAGNTTIATVKATGGGDFCKFVAASYNKAATGSANLDTSPAGIKKLYEDQLSESKKAVDSAPSAIKSDVKTLDAASEKFTASLAAVNYDFSKVPASATAEFSTPAVQTASTHLVAFVKTSCGIDLSSGDATTATSAP